MVSKEERKKERQERKQEKIKSFIALTQKYPTKKQSDLFKIARKQKISFRTEEMLKVVKKERSKGFYWSYTVHTTIAKKSGRGRYKKITTKKDTRYINWGKRLSVGEIQGFLKSVIYLYEWHLKKIDSIIEKAKVYKPFGQRIESIMRM